MKKGMTLLSVFLLAIFITACGTSDGSLENDASQEEPQESENNSPNDHEKDEDTGEADLPDEAKNQADMMSMMEALDFDEIEIEISYGKDQEFEVEIEHHSNGDIEAEVEDELKNIDIDDDLEAFNHIYPDVKKLTIDRGMEKQKVIDQVLKAFDLADDYESFEVEVTFKDGTKVSFED